jgi:short chain dehydrogenase
MSPKGKLEGRIALITGGNSGIGLATAKQFVNEGAYGFITGRRDPELAAAAKEIGRNVTGVQGDASNLGDLDPSPDSVHPMRSPRPWSFSHPTTAATSRESNCSWMAVLHKSRPSIAEGERKAGTSRRASWVAGGRCR